MTSLALFALPLSRPRALFPLQNGSTLAQVAAHHGHAEVLKVLYELTQLETLTKESVPTTGATHALAQKRTHRKAVQMIVLLFLWQAVFDTDGTDIKHDMCKVWGRKVFRQARKRRRV